MYKRTRLEVGEASAAAPAAGTVGPYSAKPHLLLLATRNRHEVEQASKILWREHEDAAILCVRF